MSARKYKNKAKNAQERANVSALGRIAAASSMPIKLELVREDVAALERGVTPPSGHGVGGLPPSRATEKSPVQDGQAGCAPRVGDR